MNKDSKQSNQWCYSKRHNTYVRVMEEHTLWDQKVYDVWITSENRVEKFTGEDDLISLEKVGLDSASKVRYITAAARIKSELTKDLLLAPLEGSLIPLPHQLHTLKKAMSSDRLRLMLADEVGLGKTIEAGLIIKELKLRGHIKRILIVAPA
ncbi:MAG: helicase, partial [Bacteroidetes bacterium]|nr:helicase [Bacteroidota bacterium]